MNTPDILANAARRFPDRDAIIDGDRRITFAEADDRASRVASAMRDLGLVPRDRVALLAFNELEYTEIQVAAMRSGLILVPLNYRLRIPELSSLIDDCTPRLLIHGREFTEHAEALAVEHTWSLSEHGSGSRYSRALESEPIDPVPGLRAEDPSVILYTSGTTGRAKGAVVSNGAMYARLNMFCIEIGIRPDDVYVHALPMFHMVSGVSYAFSYRGATSVMTRDTSPAELLHQLSTNEATHTLVVPTTINRLLNDPAMDSADLSHLRTVLYGAMPIAPELLRQAITHLPGREFIQFYGMTETAGSSLLRAEDHDPADHPTRLGSAGKDAISFETRIVDPDGRDVAPGTPGEILSRSPTMMDGYWNRPDATADALVDGWMHTGDVGYRDSSGYLFITDRMADLIVTGGENVSPREVEEVLFDHADVYEAAVVGLPDDSWGETVHASVVLQPGSGTSTAELCDFCRERLAGFKVPRSIDLVEHLPKNSTGKVLRRLIRDQTLQKEPVDKHGTSHRDPTSAGDQGENR